MKSKDLVHNYLSHHVAIYINIYIALDIKVIFGNSTLPGKEFLVKFS